MRFTIVCPLVGLLVGCSDSSTNPNTADFGGTWHFVEVLDNVPHDISCADTGVYRLTQTGTTFDGDYVQRGICRTAAGLVDNADSGSVTDGRVVGRTLRFKASLVCEYDGALDSATGRISGRGLCVLQGGGDTLKLSGVWSATR